MDSTNINPNQMPPINNISPNGDKKSVGPLVSVIIILALIIIGGLYFLKENTTTTQIPQSDPVVESLGTQNQTDDFDSIEADLNASDFDNLDQGASVMEAELQ